MRLTISAPAKINLFLDITGKRNDGYHLINTVMQSVSLYDDVIISIGEEGDSVEIDCTDPDIPCDSSNTVFKAVRKFFEYTEIPSRDVSVKIKKKIPSQAGLAGGSTDAAAVLLGLNELLETDMEKEKLAEIAEEIGADVPFCIYGGTMSATGIGTILSPLPDMPECHIVIVKPELKVSTKEAYVKSDELGYETAKNSDLIINAICNGSVSEMARHLYNKFEDVIQNPEIQKIKKWMKECGADGACMTGSGSAVFGIFSEKSEAEDCVQKLEEYYENVYLTYPVFEYLQHNSSGFFSLFNNDQ